MNYQLRVLTSHSTGVARCHEKVSFVPVVMADDSPLFDGVIHWRLERNLTETISSGTVDLAQRGIHVVCSSNIPGYFKYTFEFNTGNDTMLRQDIGVIFAPDSIRLTLATPSDFTDFWVRQLNELSAIPINCRLQKLSAQDDLALYDFQADAANNVSVSGELAMPSDPGKRYPAIIIPQGGGVRSAGVGNAAWWALQGYIALDLNAHGLSNGHPPEFYKIAGRELSGYPTRGFPDAELSQIYMRNLLLRVKRSIDAICTLSQWDGKNLFMLGASQGAWQSFAGAFFDRRVKAVASCIPAGCDLYGGGWPFLQLMPKNFPEKEKYAAILPYFDSGGFLSQLNIPLLMVAGLADVVCKADGVAAAFNACPSRNKELYWEHSLKHELTDAVRSRLSIFIRNKMEY